LGHGVAVFILCTCCSSGTRAPDCAGTLAPTLVSPFLSPFGLPDPFRAYFVVWRKVGPARSTGQYRRRIGVRTAIAHDSAWRGYKFLGFLLRKFAIWSGMYQPMARHVRSVSGLYCSRSLIYINFIRAS